MGPGVKISRTQGASVTRADPRHATAVRKLKLAVEEAKIELTRAEETSLALPSAFEIEGSPVDVDLTRRAFRRRSLLSPLEVARDGEIESAVCSAGRGPKLPLTT